MESFLKDIERIINYVCDDEQKREWLDCHIDFSEAKSANMVLSAVTLASVVYRVTEKYFTDKFQDINESIIAFFDKVITKIDKQGISKVQQYCTLSQILHYVVSAFENGQGR